MFVNARATLAGLLVALFAAAGSGAPVPAERLKAEKELAALSAKLHGAWRGGACEGRLTFRADGTYEWSGRGPGGDTDTGTWALRGDAPAPTLVLKCKTSDDPERAGTTAELKSVQVDDAGFAFKYTESSAPRLFERPKKESRDR